MAATKRESDRFTQHELFAICGVAELPEVKHEVSRQLNAYALAGLRSAGKRARRMLIAEYDSKGRGDEAREG